MTFRGAVISALVALSLAACGSTETAPARPSVGASAAPATSASPSAKPSAAAQQKAETPNLPALKIGPDKGVVGSSFTASLDGLKPGQQVSFDWGTWDGAYSTNVSAETVQYNERKFTPKRVPLGKSAANDQGAVRATFTVPEDYGEVHDVFASVDGKDVARGGFRIEFSASISPAEGPIGTPVTLTVKGMSAMLFSGSTLAVRYDNAYMGLLTATTTHGTATAKVRAAGPAGKHTFVLNAGSIPAYLNIAQSPYDFVYSHLDDKEDVQLPFTVTDDAGLPADALDWPDAGSVASLAPDAPRTALAKQDSAGVKASLEPASGPIRTKSTLTATGLPANTKIDAYWVTARGNRVTPSGWALADSPLASAQTDASGSLSTPLEVPDDLGGWHAIKLVQGDREVGQAPFFVQRSLESVSAHKVKAGDTVTIDLKGIGWTELDNGVAMTYDNAFAGYACGFNSNGDITLKVLATGAPGTHIIDLYPMVYAGRGKEKWWYWTPVLTYSNDFPALSLGYNLPAYRLAIEIVP
ncbi:MAG TPA: hypothetical protein VK009_06630 [Chloroflexota bacterium]|nr:hypothetical protein [Chloroflexota bacterium]